MAASKAALRFWLMKTEPHTFSFDDLVAAPRHTTSWDGVRNYQVRNMFRDDFAIGQQVFVYHSSCPAPGIVGVAQVVKAAQPDLTALDPDSPYSDERAIRSGTSPWLHVGVQAIGRFSRLISLQELRGDSKVADMLLLRKGSRLSVQPVTKAQWQYISSLATLTAIGLKN